MTLSSNQNDLNIQLIEPAPWHTNRHGVSRTQIVAYNFSAPGEVTVYTVPEGRTFYMCTLSHSGTHTSTWTSACYPRNAVSAVKYYLHFLYGGANLALIDSISYQMPLVFTAGESIRFGCSAGTSYLCITGWIE